MYTNGGYDVNNLSAQVKIPELLSKEMASLGGEILQDLCEKGVSLTTSAVASLYIKLP